MSNRLPTVGGDNGNWGQLLNNFLQVSHNGDGTFKNFYVNVKNDYGAVGDGSTDDTTAMQNAINALSSTGGIVFLPPGNYSVASPLNMASKGVTVMGTGTKSIIQPSASFSGAEIINITADECGVYNLKIAYTNSTSSSNPSANGIEITGARYASLRNLQLYYINGWAIEGIGTSSVNDVGCVIDAVHIEHCAKGVHGQGVSGSSYVGQWFLSNQPYLDRRPSGRGME